MRGRQILFGVGALAVTGFVLSRAQDSLPPVAHADCPYFGAERGRFGASGLEGPGQRRTGVRTLSQVTDQVASALPVLPLNGRNPDRHRFLPDSIDAHIFAALHKNRIEPAPATSDWEFIRRVTLDLTGRIPKPDRVVAFVADSSPDKRAKLVDELLARPEWIDKWTMYFGDLYQNTDRRASTSLRRFPEGRNAFYQWIHDSLASGRPYNQMAGALITAAAPNTYQSGPANWILNGYITGGPTQDIMDSMTANVFDTFLGIAHVNCLLCHNGRGHLDGLSLWGSQVTRYQAWQLAAFLSHTSMSVVRFDSTNNNVYYWNVADNPKAADYALNTTSGNRPARVAPAGCKSGQPCFYASPVYIFNGDKPRSGENYREALAREVTGDFQFARATVNYIWAQFFGRGIVDPPDTFDPARLDAENPPPAPWALQPSNAFLLDSLARRFIGGGYDLKALMREIANSETYQLSSRYNGQWNAAWEPYFARKFVRRLWGEEVHDAIVQSSGTLPGYSYTGFTDLGYPKMSYAMQFPDVVGVPTGDGNASNLLDSFIRGNRDDQPRKSDGSILQALNLMNNSFVVQRTHAAGTNASQLIGQNLNRSNPELINTLFLAILSRYPTAQEMAKAQAAIPSNGNSRTAAVQDLVWALYNKVDFVFNY